MSRALRWGASVWLARVPSWTLRRWGHVQRGAGVRTFGVAGVEAVAAAGEVGGGFVGAGEKCEEGREAVWIELEVGRELPEDGTELGAELEQALGEEVGERGFD